MTSAEHRYDLIKMETQYDEPMRSRLRQLKVIFQEFREGAGASELLGVREFASMSNLVDRHLTEYRNPTLSP
jgi:hypothetical protein